MQKLWKEFVAFIMTGNVLMLAVAFVMGGLTKKVIDDYGSFINTVINLVITGLVLFLIVKVYDAYQNRKRAAGEESAGEEPDEQVMLLREIRDALITRA
ncbi:MAG: MscL family protein [Actinomycetota bacterium]|nr:MscL family protein [Actinomycetota bacterium]